MTPLPPVAMRYCTNDDDATEAHGFAAVEVNDGEVDLIVHPYTEDARTFSLTPQQAWKLVREVARAATSAEGWGVPPSSDLTKKDPS